MIEGSMTDLTDVEVLRDGLKATIVPAGDITASIVGPLKPKMKSLVEEGVNTIVFDLARTNMVDSVGIGLIVAAHNSLWKAGGSVSVVHASSDLIDLFKALRLDQHFTVMGI
jgi:anti-anti-sigma factor